MKILSPHEISKEIDEFLKRDNPTLFAGAGVGARAGLPTWNGFMTMLAQFSRKYDPITADLIEKRASKGQFLEAAAVYKTCSDIPVGEKYKRLSEPFQKIPDATKLHSLISLPFFAVITTNYDRSLHDAYAKVYGRAPHTVELHDSTMANASYRRGFYIARIHGRSEVSKEMVLDESDYKELLKDANYVDYLVGAFNRYSCLFIGFSFVDPAIQNVLELIERRLSPDFPGSHLALLPSNAKEDLITTLKSVNIDVRFYDNTEQHFALWEGIKLSAQNHSRSQTSGQESNDKKAVVQSLPIEGIKRYIASAYAHLQIAESEGQELIPLRDIAIDGVLIGILSGGGKDGVNRKELITGLKQYLHITAEEATALVEQRMDALSYRKYVDRIDGRLVLLKTPEKNLSAQLSKLVDGVVARLQVREGNPATVEIVEIVERIIESVLMIRSWDLGAYFAGAFTGDFPNIFYTVQDQVERFAGSYSLSLKQALTRAVFSLLNRPDERESELLGNLGRVAFGLQLVTNNPCSVFAYSDVLPEKIFLDSSVLMPAIVDGHPYSPAYRDAMVRLRRATQGAGKDLSLWVAKDFLNEVISHRRLALKEINELGFFHPDELERHIRLYGAENANVFIAAYSSRVGRTKEKIRFDDFLKEIAPYTTEEELESFLTTKEGINTGRIEFSSPDEIGRAEEIRARLHDAYQNDNKPGHDHKEPILIDHEANQLSKLVFDLEKGIKTMFVTADRRFRRLASDVVPGKLGSAIISHRGLVQLIDLLLGVKTDPLSFSRLIWGGGYDDQTVTIHGYFTEIALRHYNEAYAMAMPDVLNRITERVSREVKRQQINFWTKAPSGKAQVARLMDRFENEFYINMVDAIRKKSPEDVPGIVNMRLKYLEEKTSTIRKQIENLEESILHARNQEDKREFEHNIIELKLQLGYFDAELKNLRK